MTFIGLSYSYMRNHTGPLLRCLQQEAHVAWDYPTIPGVYWLLDHFGPTLDRPLHHVLGTRLVLYSWQGVVSRVPADDRLGRA